MIRLVQIRKRLSGRDVLAGVDLEVPASGVTFVVGPSGAGKSVLARCTVGLMRIDAGEVHVDGERVDLWPERRLSLLRRRCPYVAQGSGLLDWMTLRENVELPLRKCLRLSPAEARDRTLEALRRVGAEALADRYPREVGPGVHKRAAIARAVGLDPRAILYDEPTTGVDPATARRLDALVRSLADRGTAALVVSHDLESIRRISDRVALLWEGRIAFNGPPAAFFAGRDGPRAAFLGRSAGSA